MPSQFGGIPSNNGAKTVLDVFDSPEYNGTLKSEFGGVAIPAPKKDIPPAAQGSQFGGIPVARPPVSQFGGVPAESKAGSFSSDLGASLKNRFITKPLSDTGEYVKKNVEEGADMVVDPPPVKAPPLGDEFVSFVTGKPVPDKVKDVDYPALQALERPLGATQMATAPLYALSHGYISKPIEEATGGKVKADWVDLMRMFAPAGAATAAGLATRAKEALVPAADEKIVAAAVKRGDRVATGHNHEAAYIEAGKKGKDGTLQEGFKTNKGRFITRQEAATLATKNGQVRNKLITPGQLHSEDIARAKGLPDSAGVPQPEKNVLQKGAAAIEKILSPTTVSADAKKAEGIVRKARGYAERNTMQAQEEINGISRQINALDPNDQRTFVSYIENRSKGAKLADPALQNAADTVRNVYQKVRTALEMAPATEKMGFVQDYFVHQWKDPKKAQAFVNDWVGKAGSASSTKARSIPTIEDGIKAGLTPVHSNPLDATMSYVGNMNNYLALKEIQAGMKEQNLRKFYPEGQQPAGWVALKGPGNRVLYTAEDAAKDKGVRPGINVAYAPEDAARVYNRYYTPGFTNEAGDLYRLLRAAVNGPTQILLGMSGYHYRLIANESTAAAFSRGLQALSKGDLGTAGKEVLKGTPYIGAFMQGAKGARAEAQYLGKQSGLNQKIIDLITEGGGRMTGMDKTMKNSESANFWEAWKRGTLKTDLKAAGSSIGGFVKGVGKAMDTIAYPLVAKTTPWVKNAANYDGVAEWVKMHPNASEEETLAAVRDIIDNTDNQFGEMIQGNIFWDAKLKQAAQLMVLSIGWDLGTVREVGGGMKDLSRYVAGKGELTPRAAYLIGAPISHMLNASMYQYIKTKQGPQAPQDLVYPRTGGEVTESPGTKYAKKVPERLRVPSQMNDVIAYQEDPINELKNKMAPIWKIVGDMATNSDWRGDPISYQYIKNAPSGVKAYADYIIQSLSPISAQSISKRAPGTNIGPIERLSGSIPTGMKGRDPEGYRAMMKNKEKEREKKGEKHRENSGN